MARPRPPSIPAIGSSTGSARGRGPSHGTPRQEVGAPQRKAVHDDVARHASAEPEPDHRVRRDRHEERHEHQQEPGSRPYRAYGNGTHGPLPAASLAAARASTRSRSI